MSKQTTQQAVDRLAIMATKINKFKITLDTDDQGGTKELILQEWLQELEAHELVGVKDELAALTKLVGTYTADDVDGNLDLNASVIKNLSIAVSNITAILNREKNYATKQEVSDGDDATLTAAKADATAKAAAAQAAAIAAAAADATAKAAAAQAAATAAAALDATTKADKALADAKLDAAAKDVVIKNAAAADATAKANAAQAAATAAAKVYTDAEIAKINVGANPLLAGYELLFSDDTTNSTHQLTDLDTKPNDFIFATSQPNGTSNVGSAKFSVIGKLIGVTSQATDEGNSVDLVGSIEITATGLITIKELDGGDTTAYIYRRKDK